MRPNRKTEGGDRGDWGKESDEAAFTTFKSYRIIHHFQKVFNNHVNQASSFGAVLALVFAIAGCENVGLWLDDQKSYQKETFEPSWND